MFNERFLSVFVASQNLRSRINSELNMPCIPYYDTTKKKEILKVLVTFQVYYQFFLLPHPMIICIV